MDKPERTKPKARSVTIVALLAIFVAAAVLALAGRLLPRRVGRGIRLRIGRGRAG